MYVPSSEVRFARPLAGAESRAGATQFRVEINQQYTTRYQELLMAHVADHGDVPTGNKGEALPRLGRLSPA